MEKQLLDIIREGKEVDEVSAMMIGARLKVAGKALDEVMHKVAEKLESLYKQYEDEYRLMGSTIVLYYKDRLFAASHKDDEFEVCMINGNGRFIEQIREDLNKINVYAEDNGKVPPTGGVV